MKLTRRQLKKFITKDVAGIIRKKELIYRLQKDNYKINILLEIRICN